MDRIKPLQTQKILITHFGAIGDTLMCTPALRLLRKNFPNSRIEFLTANRVAFDLLKRDNGIDKVLFLQQYSNGQIKKRFNICSNHLIGKLKLFYLYPMFVFKNFFSNYDIGIAFGPFHQAGTFSNLFFDLIGIRTSIGCFGLFTNYLTIKVDKSLLEKHWTDIYLGIINKLIDGNSKYDFDRRITYNIDGEKELAKAFSNDLDIENYKNIVVVHPGGSKYINSKLWGFEKFAAIADYLAKKYNMNILITGDGDDLKQANRVADRMSGPSKVLAGKFTFPMLALLLSKTKLLVTNDTSLLHLADAVETRNIISIWGPTNPQKIGPRNDRNYFIQSNLECSPCITLDAGDETKRCDRVIKEECLQLIKVDDVKKAIDKILG